MSASNIWVQVLSLVEARINRFTFSTWFKSTRFISDDGTALRVGVPNALFRDWFLKHYGPVVEQALAELDRHGTTVSYVPGSASLAVMSTTDDAQKALRILKRAGAGKRPVEGDELPVETAGSPRKKR